MIRKPLNLNQPLTADIVFQRQRELAEERTRQIQGREPLAPTEITSETAPTAAPTGLAQFQGKYTPEQLQTFNSLLTNLLSRAQGISTEPLRKRARALQAESLRRITAPTPERLRELSPVQQAGIREAQIGAVEAEREISLRDIEQIESSISNFENLLDTARKFGESFAENVKAPAEVVQGYKSAIESGRIDFSQVPNEVRNDVVQIVDFKAIPQKARKTSIIGVPVAKDITVRNVLSQGLEPNIMTSTGALTKGSSDKILAKGVPPTVVEYIWDAIKRGFSLDDIREDLTEQLNKETAFGYLDNFMGALQEGEETITNPFK